MNEQDLRTLVREAIARHLGAPSHPGTLAPSHPSSQASFGMFVLPAGIDTDGPCIIEPAVQCNHCGYCKSYGH